MGSLPISEHLGADRNTIPNIGTRLVVQELDRIADIDPDRPFCAISVDDSNVEAGFRDISYVRVANGSNKVAWWLEKTIGKSREGEFETLAYLGPLDLRYTLFLVAAVKVGYKALFISPRNSVAGNVNLFDLTQCTKLIITDPIAPFAKSLLAEHEMQTFAIPAMQKLMDLGVDNPTKVDVYPYKKTFEKASKDPFVVLHTSGSTGLPKPIVWTNGFIGAFDSMMLAPPPPERKSGVRYMQNCRMFNTMPPFHAAGVNLILVSSVFFNLCTVLPPPHKPLDAVNLNKALKHAEVKSAFVLPSMLEDMCKTPDLLDIFEDIECVLYAGGSLPRGAGDIIKTKTRIQNIIGATEILVIPHLEVEDPDDWEYVSINPCLNAEFRPSAEDLHDLVILRDHKSEHLQPAWHLFPDLQEYSMSDLYSPHLIKPGLWLHRGRADDIIVFVNGEKLNPISMENMLQGHAEVRSAVIAGAGRFQSCLIIEPSCPLETAAERARLIEDLWPLIQKANAECPAHGRISKSHILFTGVEKPMPRAGKGTVLRKATLLAYKSELDALYVDAETMQQQSQAPFSSRYSNEEELRDDILNAARELLNAETMGIDDDFFTFGLDSLQILNLSRRFHGLAPSTIYTYPTASNLANMMSSGNEQEEKVAAAAEKAVALEMEEILDRFTVSAPVQESDQKVILTGSTGRLGSYILDALLRSPIPMSIICFNRDGSLERQTKISQSRGLSTSLFSEKVTFMEGVLTSPDFGLASREMYARLLADTTLIIHNAWPVDFNKPLAAFTPHIEGVRKLIDFANQANRRPRILFASSIASVANYQPPNTVSSTLSEVTVPEVPLPFSPSLPSQTGYARSKHLAETLLYQSSALVPTTICRIGQIAGPVRDSRKQSWSTTEWFPSLVISSAFIGCLPESLGHPSPSQKLEHPAAQINGATRRLSKGGEIDWVPVDVVADVIVELAFSSNNSSGAPTSTDVGTQKSANGDDKKSKSKSQSNSLSSFPSSSLFRSPEVFDIVNPRKKFWIPDILPSVLAFFEAHPQSNTQSAGDNLKVVPYEYWLARLKDSAIKTFETGQMDKNPALKLMAFWDDLRCAAEENGNTIATAAANGHEKVSKEPSNRGETSRGMMPRLETVRTEEQSRILRDLEGVEGEWVQRWMTDWFQE